MGASESLVTAALSRTRDGMPKLVSLRSIDAIAASLASVVGLRSPRRGRRPRLGTRTTGHHRIASTSPGYDTLRKGQERHR
jgi:hypothetical protein